MITGTQVRAVALGLPAAKERTTWGHPTFRVGEHIFLGMDEDARTATLKATKGTQQALIAIDPVTYGMAPRVGRHGWVRIHLGTVDAEDLRELVTEAWRLTASTGMVDEFDSRSTGTDL